MSERQGKRELLAWALAVVCAPTVLIADDKAPLELRETYETIARNDAPTPFEAAGYEPLWAESFTDASFDCMRISPAHGMLEDYDTFLLPGAFHYGQKNATKSTEQQIKYYRDLDGGEPLAQTVEWTMGLTQSPEANPEMGGDSHRMFFRVRSHEDGAHLRFTGPEEKADLRHQRPPDAAINRKEGKVPKRMIQPLPELDVEAGDWVHCVLSYRRDPDSLEIQANFAANGVMFSWSGPSRDPLNLRNRENWSFEWASSLLPEDGWYMRDIRGYEEFIEAEEMREILKAHLESHLADQPDISDLEGLHRFGAPVAKSREDVINIEQPPAEGLPANAVTLTMKDFVVRAPEVNQGGPEFKEPILVLKRQDPSSRNVFVNFEPMRVLKVEYDTRGEGMAEGAYQSSFRIGAGFTGWVENLAWHTIAKKDGLTEGGVFTFYPDIIARGLLIDRVSVKKNGAPMDFWFWNLKNLSVTGIPVDAGERNVSWKAEFKDADME